MELTERDIYRTPSTLLTSLLHRSCYTPACGTVLVTHLLVAPFLLHTCWLHRSCYTPAGYTVLVTHLLVAPFLIHKLDYRVDGPLNIPHYFNAPDQLVAPFLLHTCLLHRSCYTPACCTVLVTHLLVTPFLLHTCLWHRSSYSPESRESGRLAVLGNVTKNGLLAETTSTCPIVVSHQADVHLQVVVLTEAESFNGWMDGCI